VTITACNRAAAVQRGVPAPDPLAKASARQRSNVATLIPASRDTKSIAELSGGNNRPTIRSLYACPYRATSVFQRPQRFRSYLSGNLSDTGGRFVGATMADPLEGPHYGSCKAMVMRRADGTPWINSFAHGRTVYELRYDARAVSALIDAAATGATAGLFVTMMVNADLAPDSAVRRRTPAARSAAAATTVLMV
jgi:hypothetical protein